MSLIEDDKLRELQGMANDLLEQAVLPEDQRKTREEIEVAYAEFEVAKRAYDQYRYELFHRYGAPITGKELTYRTFEDSMEEGK